MADRIYERLGVPVIIFLDEPGLAGFGSSAFITISAELISRLLTEVVEAVHAAGGLAGIHVCANTDWNLAFQSNFDIINFDSYSYFDKFTLYKEECLRFITEGGNIAWGVVPTSDVEAIRAATRQASSTGGPAMREDLVAGKMQMEELIAHSLFTPSCGCGSLPENDAEKVSICLRVFAG